MKGARNLLVRPKDTVVVKFAGKQAITPSKQVSLLLLLAATKP